MELKFCARILQNENMDAAYVEVPYENPYLEMSKMWKRV